MDRTNVQSSNINSIGYEDSTGTLEVEFKGGGIYKYSKVPKDVFLKFMSASSHGKYFNKVIMGKYPTAKLR